MKVKIPILLYHDLESAEYKNEKTDAAARDTIVNADEFERQIMYLAEHNYETISVNDYFRAAKESNGISSRKIIVTFDDGHMSNYYLAFPILKKYGFKATFFIVSGRVNHKYFLTGEQIREIAEGGMEIGSHGMTHKYFPLMTDDEMRHELFESKRILESIIQRDIDYFAFPGGHYTKKAFQHLKAAGYSGACSCLQGLNSLSNNPYLLKRIEVRRNVLAEEFGHMFNPAHIAFYRFIDMTKNMLKRSIGVEAYSDMRKKLYKYYIFKR